MASTTHFVTLLRTQLLSEMISFEEYAFNLTLQLIQHDLHEEVTRVDALRAHLETVPAEFRCRYLAYLRDFLIPLDFQPSPIAFMATGTMDEQQVAEMRHYLRPRYGDLYQNAMEMYAS